MPHQTLFRGATANLGAGLVNDLTLNGVGCDYSLTIGPGPAVAGTLPPGMPIRYAVNRLPVSVTNTTNVAGPTNLTISW